MAVGYLIKSESVLCLTAMFLGMVMGVEYDLIRIFRRVIVHKRVWLICVEDIVFWIVAAFQVFSVIYEEGQGIVRVYLVVFMVVGAVLYRNAFGKYLVKYISEAINFIFKPLKNVLRSVTIMRKARKERRRLAKLEREKKRSQEHGVRVKKRTGVKV